MKKILIVITALFFAVMLILALSAEAIHNAGLPEVTSGRVKTYAFEKSYANKDGKTETFFVEKPALTNEQLENGVYIVYTADKNGTARTFVKKVEIETGAERNGFFEIVSGISFGDRIVTKMTAELFDGCEVIEIH